MKKLFLLAAVFTALFSACTKDEKTDEANNKLVFELSAVNTLQTRADLYSQEAVHAVENVKIYAFKESGLNFLYYKTFDIPNWTKGSNSKTYEVSYSEMVPNGIYKFLAVGRDATDNFSLPQLTPNETNYNDFIVSVSAAGMETEIFAGTSLSTSIALVGGITVPIIMTRQVAGILGYFKNIPVKINNTTVQYLRLTVNNSNKALNLTTGNGSASTASNYNLIEVDFTDRTADGDYYSGNDLSSEGVVKLDNTQLNGAFVIPVNNVSLTLGLYDASNTALKEWIVLNDNLLPIFNIQPNHFYSLGTKVAAGSTTGTTEDPVADDPIDLSKDQDITISISPDWTWIHEMNLQ